MEYSAFAFFMKQCHWCRGGIVNQNQRCSKCKGTGIDYDHDSISIEESALHDLLHFNSIAAYGEMWLSFVDWSQIYRFDNFEKLLKDGWLDYHPEKKAPRYGNYRDDFPESFYSISIKGRLVVREPGLYIGIDDTAATPGEESDGKQAKT